MMSALETNFGQTPSQTVGPYFAYGLTAAQYGYDFDQPFDAVLALDGARGERIRIEGRVFDGDGKPITDALVEISQADGNGALPAVGRRAHAPAASAASAACGTGTDAAEPLRVPHRQARRRAAGEAPHINVIVMMRGMLLHAFTRIYFSDEAEANAKDAVLAQRAGRAPRHADRAAQRARRRGDLPLRHPHAGPERDGVLRRLSSPERATKDKARCKRALSLRCRASYLALWMRDSGTVFSSPGSELM